MWTDKLGIDKKQFLCDFFQVNIFYILFWLISMEQLHISWCSHDFVLFSSFRFSSYLFSYLHYTWFLLSVFQNLCFNIVTLKPYLGTKKKHILYIIKPNNLLIQLKFNIQCLDQKCYRKRRAMQFKLFYTDVVAIPFPSVVLNLSRLLSL